jgi:glycosidase
MKKLLFVFILATHYCIGQVVERMEPPFWWAGMQQHTIELCLYGKDIQHLEVFAEKLPILKTTRTENKNYLFVTLETEKLSPGTFIIQLKNKKAVVAELTFELKSRVSGSAERKGFGTEDVVYLLMPDRFANGDENNDSHASVLEKVDLRNPGGRHGGDLQGMTNHLDYIKELGATTIWPTPLFEDNDSTYSYHTYGQSDLYRIDPRYGTNDDYLNFVKTAHQKGLKVIQDVVPNHWGYNHWMLKDLPTYEWIHQFPGYKQTNYRITAQMDPHRSKDDEELCEKGWFVRSMPDLNQSNPLAFNYLLQNTLFWMEYAGLDGLRVDTYPYNDKDAIAKWTQAIMKEYPNTNLVGEVWLHNQAQISYWQKDSPIGALQDYNSGLPAVMDFTLHDAFLQAFKEPEQGWDKGMVRFYENFVNDFLYANPQNLLIFMENHDTQRFNELYPNIRDYQLGLSLLATCRGIPQIYYGSEIGMQGKKELGDADIRQDFPGGWNFHYRNAFTKEGRTEQQEAYHSFTRKVLNWRKTSLAAQKGKMVQFLPENNVYAFFRVYGDETVMVVINNSSTNQIIQTGRFKEFISTFETGVDVASGNRLNMKEDNWSIPAKTSWILELKK